MARRSAFSWLALPSGLLVTARIIGAGLAYLAVLATASVIAYGVALVVIPDSARGTFGLLGLGVAEAAAFAAVLLLWRYLDGRRVQAIGLQTPRAGPRWLKGALIGALMMGFVVAFGYTLVDGATWEVNSDALRAAIVLVVGLIGFAIQGPSEEVLFRGYILENARKEWGVRPAVVLSSVVFALFHASNPGFGLLPLVNLVLFGAGTALYRLYVDDGQLWGVFAIHTVWNWLQQVVFGLPNSGMTSASENTLFLVTPNSALPDALWGGGFGPEGTLAASVVLLALIAFSLRRARSALRN